MGHKGVLCQAQEDADRMAPGLKRAVISGYEMA
jgi:hypothetical protein